MTRIYYKFTRWSQLSQPEYPCNIHWSRKQSYLPACVLSSRMRWFFRNGQDSLALAITGSPAGLSRVNGVRRIVVLKHETSTLRQRHNFISTDFKFGVGDYIKEVTNPDKVGSGPMSGRDATWGQHTRVLWLLFFFCFHILQQSYSSYLWTNVRA